MALWDVLRCPGSPLERTGTQSDLLTLNKPTRTSAKMSGHKLQDSSLETGLGIGEMSTLPRQTSLETEAVQNKRSKQWPWLSAVSVPENSSINTPLC